MIHGEFFGKNVVIRPAPAVETIAVIDWETAAVGPQVLDLVSMTAGRWTAEQRTTMRRAYFESAAAAGTMPTWDTFITIVDAAAAVNALAWLGWWSDGDDAHITRWTREACFVLDTSRSA
jgi:aminoglycoside phosphotransferase (APT) family kinase protein